MEFVYRLPNMRYANVVVQDPPRSGHLSEQGTKCSRGMLTAAKCLVKPAEALDFTRKYGSGCASRWESACRMMVNNGAVAVPQLL